MRSVIGLASDASTRWISSAHVTASLVSRLRVPRVDSAHPARSRLAALSRALARGGTPTERMPEYAELQALVACLYELTETDFAHVLGTFPLIPGDVRSAALQRFSNLR